jgi:large subunit ribosomal protein L23
MNHEERLYTILIAPHISEKTNRIAERDQQHTFQVRMDATKPEIRQAVEKLFEVEVDSVQTAVVKGKRKRFGRQEGQRSSWKKAYVQLKPGFDIDFATR